MENEVHYNCKQLLDLLSIYEGELQAREILIEALQRQQNASLRHGMSSSTILYQQRDPFNSLLCDSQQIDDCIQCSSCGNRILQTAKVLQIHRECDRKINKAINMMKKRYVKINQEANSNEGIKDGENCYIKSLEIELDECHNQLKKQQNEFDELQEKKTVIEDKFAENDEVTKQIILYLLEERKGMFEHLNELQKQITTLPSISVINSSSSMLDESQIQFHSLKEENTRLKSQLYLIQMEKGSLQKKLDYLLRDLQQSAFHQHFQFLQPKGPTDKEMVVIGNGLISPSEHFQGLNRIRNSSSFPQSFYNNQSNRSSSSISDGNDGGKFRMQHQFPTNHFEQRHSSMQNNATGPITGPIPLMASNSTMIMRRLPPSVPRTSTQPIPPLSSQLYRRVGNEQQQKHSQREATMNTTNIQLGQPQAVITRRSTSLPRPTISPSSKQHSLQHKNREEPSAEHFFYHQQSSRGIIDSIEDRSHQK